jgi:hypothetical protein
MATHESGDVEGKRWDEGAMFFTVRDQRFRKIVDDWIQGGRQLSEMMERESVCARDSFHECLCFMQDMRGCGRRGGERDMTALNAIWEFEVE